MGRGLGPFQHDLLVVLQRLERELPWGATPGLIRAFWPAPKPKLNLANIYRGLGALTQRGLVSMADQASYEPHCRCDHHAHQHAHDQYACQGRSRHGRRCGCRRYHKALSPRACWRIQLTDAGRLQVSDDEISPICIFS